MRKALAWTALIAAAANFAAGASTGLLAAGGTPLEADGAARQAFVATHTLGWQLTWLAWIAAATTLVAFYAVIAVPNEFGRFGLAAATAGLGLDLAAETVLIFVLPSTSGESYAALERFAFAATGFGANGLYTIAGSVLVYAAWRAGTMSSRLSVLSIPIWVTGASLSIAAWFEAALAMTLLTGLLVALVVGWLGLVGLLAWRAS